ncbi:MAG: ABC transporter substrate-binding protein [Mariprofundales bacterium]|nr:ABC transporter substrate-binding protein [Mariprofundales bacterium]
MKQMLLRGITLILLTTAWLPSSFAADNDSPQQVVETTVQAVIDTLQRRENKKILTESDRQAIRAVLTDRFDFVTMTRGSIGKPWRKLDREQRKKFVTIFTQLMEYTYGNRLSSYHGQKITYHPATFKKKRARVKSEVHDGDKITPVEYRLRRHKSGWKIYDIKIEGVSMIGTFRKDFRSMIERHGIDGLYDALNKKVKRLINKSRKQ